MTDYLTTEDVRDFLRDRWADDNELDGDLSFTDEDIERAMKRAAREYNSIPPFVSSAHWNRLSALDNIMLWAVVEQLDRSLLANMRRNDFDHTAGGVGVNLVDKRIKHLEREVEEMRGLWEPAARSRKLTINYSLACGVLG